MGKRSNAAERAAPRLPKSGQCRRTTVPDADTATTGEPGPYNQIWDQLTGEEIHIDQMMAISVDLIANDLAHWMNLAISVDLVSDIDRRTNLKPFQIVSRFRKSQSWGIAAYDSEARGWYSPLRVSVRVLGRATATGELLTAGHQ